VLSVTLYTRRRLNRLREKDDLYREERKNVPQGLKGRMMLLGSCTAERSTRELPIVSSLRDSICVKSYPALPCRATDCPVPSGLIASGYLRFFSTPFKVRT
jgi:hypothetical protein